MMDHSRDQEARRRSALLRLSTGIAAAHDEREVCQAVVDGLHDRDLGYDFVGVFLLDPRSGDRVMQASVGWEGTHEGYRIPAGHGLSERPLKDGEVHYTPKVKREAEHVVAAASGSELDLPLSVDDEVIGVIVVEGTEEDAFHREDLEILTAAARQASLAIGRVRLIEQERRRAEEQTALMDTMRDLSGELELEKLLEALLQRAVRLLGVTGGELAIFDEEAEELVIVAGHDMGADAVGTRMEIGEGAMGHVAQTKEALVIPDYQEWTGRSEQYTQDTVQSVVAAPLMIGSRLVGVIAAVHADPGHAFDDEDLRLLELFAPQAAVAIENAHLFTAEHRRAAEQQALLDTLADMAGELELSVVLKDLLVRAAALLDVTGGELAIHDQNTGELRIAASHNMGADAVGTTMAPGEGAMGQVAETMEPLIIPDYLEWEGRAATYTDGTVQSVMAAPLVIGTRLVGVLAVVHSEPGRRFGEDDIGLMKLFATQAAIAVENARLFTEARHREQYFEDLVQNNPVAIVTMDLDFNITSCNPAFEELFGWREEEILGRNLDRLVNTEESLAEAAHYTEEAYDGAVIRGLGKRTRRDGTLVDVELAGVPVMVDGEQVGIMGLYHDITDLLRAQEDAQAANQAKSNFLANMSHELRTPLNAILGYSEMLVEEAEDDGNDEYIPDLRKIESAGRHLLALINDVLDLSKIEAGKTEIYLEHFDAAEMVEAVATTIRPLVKNNSNELIVECEDGLGEMHSDLTKVRQILLNLLSNASKFTENGTVTLSVTHEHGGDGDWLTFRVADTGIGMDAETRRRVFEPFFTTKLERGGTGLGLSTSYGIVQQSGGTIRVESTKGVGTTFVIRFPAAEGEVTPEGPVSQAPEPVDHATGTILLVEDDPSVRRVARKVLTRAGFEVEEAGDAEVGLAMLEAAAGRFDVVLTDLVLPGMGGRDLVDAIREHSSDQAVIVMSGYAAGSPGSRGELPPEIAFIRKPFTPEGLLGIVRENMPRTP